MAVEAPKKRSTLNRVVNFSHDLAHGFGEHVAQPLINVAQYNTFEHPETHRKQIDRQMYRTFKRAGSSLKLDNLWSNFFFAQLIIAAGFGEHVSFPMQWLPFVPHELTAIPLLPSMNVHIDVPIPPFELANNIPGVHLPASFSSDGPYWPIFTGDVFMSLFVNVPNTVRAFREKRPVKGAYYAFSSLAAFSHAPIIFNSFWWELALRPAERKAGQSFAEKVSYVLEGEDIPKSGESSKEPKTRFGRFMNRFKLVRELRKRATGEIDIDPKDRHVFAQAVRNRYTHDKPKNWWEERLREIDWDIANDEKQGLPHAREHVEKNEAVLKRRKFPTNIIPALSLFYHKHMRERLEEKEEAVGAAQNFLTHEADKENN